ncbi:GGDEF domain-containing protein [Pseudomonas cremoricolorata]|uniref:diguanylate cyclase n=1 Tax=Pseudomonas cremoricolorata TaxID=157783 RepID=A0A089YHW7_9PSED|nr:GGDEF domain-containing protein [Pseudomonas cremoricolorata]AIR91288.1 diguanylate cyclase [Pseudomonas cremoricolorata]
MQVLFMVSSAQSRVLPYVLLFSLTLGLTLAGILARPFATLSLFWPVNAVLAGLLLRHPRRATPLGWGLVYAAMVTADLAYGSDWGPAVSLNLCNLGAVLTLWWLMMRLPLAQRRLRTAQGVLYLLGASALAAVVAASLACLVATPWFEESLRSTWLAWFSEQFSTSVLVLPLVLTAPAPRTLLRGGSQAIRVTPLLVLLAALGFGLMVGGPGAIAFPIAALLWCALSYSPFLLSLLTLGTGSTLIVAVAQNVMHFSLPQSESAVTALMSARLGIAMLVLGPLLVACVSQANRLLLGRLEHQAAVDHLTGALSRSAFTHKADSLLEQCRAARVPLTLMMLDIDHFKAVNDRHGHAVGDLVLRQFARTVQDHLPEAALFARLGGEEFAIVVSGVAPHQASFIAERLRRAIEELAPVHAGQRLHITVSTGLSGSSLATPGDHLDALLAHADQALYQAKAMGRNRVVQYQVRREVV